MAILFLFLVYSKDVIPLYYIQAKEELISEYLSSNSLESIWGFMKIFIVFSGGVPVLGVLLLFSKDKISHFLIMLMLGYLVFVSLGGVKYVHYYAPVSLFSLTISLRYLMAYAPRWIARAFSLICIISIIFMLKTSWPKIYRIFNDRSQFSSRTCYLFPSDEEIPDQVEEILERSKYEVFFNDGMENRSIVASSPDEELCDYYFSAKSTVPVDAKKAIASFDGGYYFWTNIDIDSEIKNIPTKKQIFSEFFKRSLLKL